MNRNQSLYPNTYQQELQKSKQFGQKVRGGIDRGLGFLGGVGLGTYGMASDATSGILSALGLDDAAVFHARNADELHNRAKQQFLKGYSGGGSRSTLPGGSRALSRTANLIDDGTAPLYNFTYDDIPDAYPQNQSSIPSQATLNSFTPSSANTPVIPQSLPTTSLLDGAYTQDQINEILSDLPKSPQALPESPEMTQYKENILTDPRGGDKSLEGAAQTLGITEEKLGSMSKKEKESALQKAFVGGVDSYQESLLGKKLKPKFKNEKEEIDYYKKQFADATGIKIDGKPNTKDAMIAFGLALMQNKAGKKFDVGKMLQATGEAGEKAMPLLIKARDKSEAQQLAAGQYALERQIADRDYFRDLEAEEFNRKRELYYALQEAALTGDNEEYTKALEKLRENNIKVGGVDFKIQRGTDETNGRVVFADPTFDSPKVLDAYAKTEAGLESIDQIDSLLDDISQMSKDDPAGQAQFLATSKAKKFLKLIGFDQNNKEDSKYFTADGVLKTDKLDAIQKAIVSRFKRFMTQETGNGISNVDVKMIQAQTGELDFFTDVDSARERVKQLRFLFTQSKNTLNPIIKELTDRSQYRAGSAGNEQFSKVQNQIEETIFGGRFKDIFEKAVTGEDAQGNTIYNITLADV